MLNEETIRLILEMTGSRSIEEVTRKLQEQKVSATELAGSYEVLERQSGEYAIQQEQISRRTKEQSEERVRSAKIVNQIIEEEQQAMRQSAAASGVLEQGHKELGRGMLQTSFIVQDFTSVLSGGGGLSRAIMSVQNNIPMLLLGLGAGAGLAGTVSMVSMAVGAAIPLLQSFAGAEEKASESTKKLADQVERLKNLQTPEEKKQQGDVEEFLAMSDAKVVRQGIGAALKRRAVAQAESAARSDIEEFGVVQRDYQTEFAAQAEQYADKLFGGMVSNDVDRAAVAGLAQELPGVFPKNFAQDLSTFSDKAVKEADAEEKRVERFGERASRAATARAKRRAIQELNTAGEENEAITMRQRAEDAEVRSRDFIQDPVNARPGTAPKPRPFRDLSDMVEQMKDRQRREVGDFGIHNAMVDQAAQAGVLRPRFPVGMTPAQARAQANQNAEAMGRRMQPNAMNAQGMPVHDQQVQALMDEVEKLQGLTEQNHKYVSRAVERLNRIRSKTGQLENQSRQINNATMDRGR